MGVSVADARRHLDRSEASRRRRASARADRLRERLPDAARLLRERFRAEGVVLFGSLAPDGGEPTEGCDVDLAVSGLAPEAYFPALAELAALFSAPVDLVRLEEAPPSLRRRVEEVGEPL